MKQEMKIIKNNHVTQEYRERVFYLKRKGFFSFLDSVLGKVRVVGRYPLPAAFMHPRFVVCNGPAYRAIANIEHLAIPHVSVITLFGKKYGYSPECGMSPMGIPVYQYLLNGAVS